MSIQKPKTRKEIFEERYKDNPKKAIVLGLLSCFTSNNAPAYNDSSEVYTRAQKDFSHRDYSEAWDYVVSLVELSDHYESVQDYLL